MANLSLSSSVRSCRFDTAFASKLQSDRTENPYLMVCPPWSGVDSYGRTVSADSFDTKSAGCNSPGDRVIVENSLRPQYIEYVNLDAQGFRGNLYDNMIPQQAAMRTQTIDNISNITGNPGVGYGAQIRAKCQNYSYTDAMAQEAMKGRKMEGLQSAYKSAPYRVAAGV